MSITKRVSGIPGGGATQRVSGAETVTFTPRVGGVVTEVLTSRVLSVDSLDMVFNPWGDSWGESWGATWGGALPKSAVGLTERVSAGPSVSVTRRVA